MATSTQTALCGILLHPAGHTRSPAMHAAAYAALGLDAVYLAFDVPPADLADAVAGLRALGARQLSVSIPHKEAIVPLLDAVDETARRIGAVNTVVCRNHRLHGSNTDWLGAVRALEDRTALDGRRAIVLGAGGTARAVAYGLRERGAGVTILNRTEARARSLAKDLGVEAGGPLTALADTPHEVLVNTTSIGLDSDDTPVECEWIAAGATVMDAVYSPERTRLLREADARGATTISGKWMLIHQAAAQLQAWAGNDWNSARNAQVTKAMAHAFDEAGRAG